MSLVGTALRVTFTKLVTGQTMAASCVYDAPVEPIVDVLMGGVPVISVYTGFQGGNILGREYMDMLKPETELTFQCYLPPGGKAGETMNYQGAGAAMALDMMVRQIFIALSFGVSPWLAMWKKLVVGYGDLDSRPILIEIEGGLRIPCREITLSLKTIPEPGIGIPLNAYWQMFVDLCADDPDHAPLAQVVSDMITLPNGLANWQQVSAAAGLTFEAAQAIGIAPQDDTATDEGAAILGGDTVNPNDDAITLDPAEVNLTDPPGP